MKKLCLLSLLFALTACSSDEGKKLSKIYYLGALQIDIPAGATAQIITGSKDHHVLYKYGNEKGKNYLAISQLINGYPVDFGCDVEQMVAAIFTENKNPGCNKSAYDGFKEAYKNKADVSVVASDNATIYFSKKDKSNAFVKTSAGIVHVESDWLDLKNYVSIDSTNI
ncbi:MAG: hypothetical protein CSA49_05085 [Gammaproteobacteria bacterium]|nr:MAG: hypothetical protein CSA49_05085 [Gammaproteobacteria bacterium]